MPEVPATPEFETARSAVEDVLRRNVDSLGPHHIDDDGDIGGLIEGALLSEWVLVSSWIDPDDGEATIVTLSSESLVRHHLVGLLHMAMEN